MGEKGKSKVLSIVLHKVSDNRWEIHSPDLLGYFCMVLNIDHEDNRNGDYILNYCTSPFKGSIQGSLQDGTPCYSCNRKNIDHVALGVNHRSHSRMYFTVEYTNVKP